MVRPGPIRAWPFIVLLAAGAWGCAAAPSGPEPILLPDCRRDTAATGFGDLAVVLAAAVDDDGRIDPTALVVHLPRLERQLAVLAGPWPASARAPGSEERLCWLYNARAAWSLHIVARDRRLAGTGKDEFALAETISLDRLQHSPFPLDGGTSSLSRIDKELAAMDDVRIACVAPGATDFDGRLPRRPFEPGSVRTLLDRLFSDYIGDGRRVVIDHDGRRLRVPPMLWRARGEIIAGYQQRYRTADAMLATALRPHVDERCRRRLAEALGYPAALRRGPAPVAISDGRTPR